MSELKEKVGIENFYPDFYSENGLGELQATRSLHTERLRPCRYHNKGELIMVRSALQGSIGRGVVLGLIAVGPMASAVRAAAPDSSRLELEEIVVTGSRLRVSDVEGPAPVTVFDRDKIDALGVVALPDLFKHLSQQPYKRDEGVDATGAQYVQIRGLGLDTTLVLINGRRVVPSAANVAFNGFDLNTIPLVAVERVEVLSDAASAVYGADALGGVVNIILKREAPRFSAEASYGSAEGGAEEQRVAVSSGYAGKRLHASLIADFFDRGSLLGAERERYADQDFRRFGGTDWREATAQPGNVSSLDGSNLPGLSSPFAAVPAGSSGVGLTPADFLATAGQVNLDSLNRYFSTVPEAQRRSAAAFAEFEFTPSLTAFAELLYVDRSAAFEYSPSALSGQTVPAANPFNPFGTDVAVDVLLTGLGSRRDVTESELTRAVGGLRGTWRHWDWEASVLHTDEAATSWLENGADLQRVAAALAATDPAQALNVFQDGPGGSPALLASLKAISRTDRYGSAATQASAFARGPLFWLPTGSVDAVIGAEWRTESMEENDNFRVSQDREVAAGYAELRMPLVRSDRQRPLLHSLALTLAARLDNYSDFGDTLNPQYGLIWRPVSDWLVRASYGTSFRPPSLFELYAPRRTSPLRVTDPRRNEVADTFAITGGNPLLDPIEGSSASAGVVFTPSATPGLRLSANWWRVELEQRISSFSTTLLLQNEARFAERVQRAAPTPADVAAGLPGRLTLLNVSRINYGSLETRGVDFDASYRLDTALGQFSPAISATWVGRYRTVNLPNTPAVDRVGIANALGALAKWRVVGSLSWERNGVGLTANARYSPAYLDANPLTGRATGREIPAQTLVDLQASIDLEARGDAEAWWRRGCKIAVGVTNLFDKAPPFAEIGFSSGYDPSQGEMRQRFGYVRVTKGF